MTIEEKRTASKIYRDAHKAEAKVYRDTHRDEIKASNKIYGKIYYEAHKEELSAYKKEHRDEIRERNRRYREKNRDKVRAYQKLYRKSRSGFNRNYQLRYHYGISVDDYEKLFIEQDGCCAICGKRTKLDVDHCHKSGRIRGLLCRQCNHALGLLYDNPELFKIAIEYLNESNINCKSAGT